MLRSALRNIIHRPTIAAGRDHEAAAAEPVAVEPAAEPAGADHAANIAGAALRLPEVDALRGSPFWLLDAHSQLHLVAEVVPEADWHCLALACRALRDAVSAHLADVCGGTSRRTRTNVGALASSRSRFLWARALGERGPCWVQRW
jgi:hypothetical protein